MDLSAKITGIKYTPLLCRNLNTFTLALLGKALANSSVFILDIDQKNKIALSWWVSAKRTRSYPYARIYDSLGFSGKKVTIIPVIKDEGKEGDRDFLQWDTVSLMSLLGVYVIIGYYNTAERSQRYRHKITNQRFDIDYIKTEIRQLLSYQSDALHWNLSRIDKIGKIGENALESYQKISKKLKVEMHSWNSAEKRINQLLRGKTEFMKLSREYAEQAQKREGMTVQPKERLSGTKAVITITNYLGGCYYFTSDEVEIKDDRIYLVEGKHSKLGSLPSLEDIKDGLLKMLLFSNLEDVKIGSKKYNHVSMLKLTVAGGFKEQNLSESQKSNLDILRKEAQTNNFKLNII
ncbi:MAG: hypothetical protein AUJ85_01485 [Elusimicrobia bacterium CG1_02_37_114]|nr:MAG: hypothetical protein AUJ85_01485 [Elusimicrobia bacterium CG1_02_37_114]PIV53253.1 MAG: hypothetical protein COS17_05020 [Elusimicrobia bacterium CG02_land_8_20_14_3_00_37_13]PIZ14450.1 MAG: hypothetical protein COY53_00015 [Elusimicrobia bacterium CG_4_10_14_0_8_um_filter_37_32]